MGSTCERSSGAESACSSAIGAGPLIEGSCSGNGRDARNANGASMGAPNGGGSANWIASRRREVLALESLRRDEANDLLTKLTVEALLQIFKAG